MAVSLSPSAFGTDSSYPQAKIRTREELEQLKKEPTILAIEGDIYHSQAIRFKKLSLEELQREKITVDTAKHERISFSDGSTDNTKRIVAIRDPLKSGEVLTFDLSKKTIERLKEKFGNSNNFFERGDGVLRLNGEAENFVASWMQDIKKNRNYDKADADGNGRIDGTEAQNLAIGFERHTDYDYLGKKLVNIHLNTGENTYQRLGNTPDAHHLFATDEEKAQDEKMGYVYKRTILHSQYTKFENSVEKELDHTLRMDANLDGTVTLEEGLADEFGKTYQNTIQRDVQENHDRMLEDHAELNDDLKVRHQDMGLYGILTEEEKTAMMETFRKESKAASEAFKKSLLSGPLYLGGSEIRFLPTDETQQQSPQSPPTVSSLTRFDVSNFEYMQTKSVSNDATVTSQQLQMTYTATTLYYGEANAAAQAGAQKATEAFPEIFAEAAYGIDLKA